MLKWFKSLISENSDQSMTRFLSLVCVFSASIIAIYTIFSGKDANSVVGICSTFLGFGLGAKVIQKNFEKGSEISSDKV